jgi:hypothetical protein
MDATRSIPLQPAGAGRHIAPIATPIPRDRASSLARWNRVLSGLHGIQFVVMLAVASTAAVFAPYLSTVKVNLVDGKFAGLEAVKVELFSMPLAWFIASFLAMSAIAHFLAGFPLRSRYEAWLARGMNPLRWVEYAFSSTVMIVAIAYISFIQDVPGLLAIAGCNVAMILFGWSMEAANEGRRDHPDWKHFVFGCIAGIAPWIGIVSILLAYGAQADLPAGAGIPAFVYVIVASLRLLQRLRDHDGPPVPEDRPLARLPRGREDLHGHEPGRQVPARLAGVQRDASPGRLRRPGEWARAGARGGRGACRAATRRQLRSR